MSFTSHFENLIRSWNLNIHDVIHIRNLMSFHDIERKIYKRNDTQQYIFIQYENSWRDNIDDFFTWRYITENGKNNYLHNDVNFKY